MVVNRTFVNTETEERMLKWKCLNNEPLHELNEPLLGRIQVRFPLDRRSKGASNLNCGPITDEDKFIRALALLAMGLSCREIGDNGTSVLLARKTVALNKRWFKNPKYRSEAVFLLNCLCPRSDWELRLCALFWRSASLHEDYALSVRATGDTLRAATDQEQAIIQTILGRNSPIPRTDARNRFTNAQALARARARQRPFRRHF